jgi:hypothetical protein
MEVKNYVKKRLRLTVRVSLPAGRQGCWLRQWDKSCVLRADVGMRIFVVEAPIGARCSKAETRISGIDLRDSPPAGGQGYEHCRR